MTDPTRIYSADLAGQELRVFEYEESLRATSSMDEEGLFHLRKLHFLVDFCWNIEVYKPLLKVALAYGANSTDTLEAVLARGVLDDHAETSAFFRQLDAYSCEEWFDGAAAIGTYFAEEKNFRRLFDQEFEKLSIMFSIVLLRDAKRAFGGHFRAVVEELGVVPADLLKARALFHGSDRAGEVTSIYASILGGTP